MKGWRRNPRSDSKDCWCQRKIWDTSTSGLEVRPPVHLALRDMSLCTGLEYIHKGDFSSLYHQSKRFTDTFTQCRPRLPCMVRPLSWDSFIQPFTDALMIQHQGPKYLPKDTYYDKPTPVDDRAATKSFNYGCK